jgi:hypothetical protein
MTDFLCAHWSSSLSLLRVDISGITWMTWYNLKDTTFENELKPMQGPWFRIHSVDYDLWLVVVWGSVGRSWEFFKIGSKQKFHQRIFWSVHLNEMNTGEILRLASLATHDPTQPRTAGISADWKRPNRCDHLPTALLSPPPPSLALTLEGFAPLALRATAFGSGNLSNVPPSRGISMVQ